MKKDKAKDVLGKVGKLTLPAMMLLGGAWNSNFTALSASEMGIRANDAEQRKPVIEVVNNEGYDKILVADADFNFTGECWGCDTSCGGCTGCTGTCLGGCSGGCTGTNTADPSKE
jgi:hypothetical protein